MGSTDWIREDYLRPLPTQRELWPDFQDVHLGIPFGGVLYRDVSQARAAECGGSGTAEADRVRRARETTPCLHRPVSSDWYASQRPSPA